MGLEISHNTFAGSYGEYGNWRRNVAKAAGLPPLRLMEGFYVPLKPESYIHQTLQVRPTLYHGLTTGMPIEVGSSEPYLQELDSHLPIKWECLKQTPLLDLINHSDSDGEIAAELCSGIADELTKLLPAFEGDDEMVNITKKFIKGLTLAHSKNEPVVFS